MRTDRIFSWLFLILSIYMNIHVASMSGQCLSDQQSLLLQLKNTLIFNPTESKILVKWNRSSDCCTWDGVTCEEGNVVGLKLSNESISGGIFENSTLFNLVHLKSLDLSLNGDLNSTIPSRIVNLTNLSYLNLSRSWFVGEIPKELSRLTKMVTLDFSSPLFSKLVCPNLTMLVQNLTHLEEIYFDGVNISAQKNELGEALAFSLPNLRVLSLSNCQLAGPFAHSLSKLQSLSVVRLDYNNLSAPVPGFFANFSNLTSLHLSQCGLYGSFPKEIFQVPTLQTLDISSNELLQGSFPEFPQNSALQSLVISFTKFAGSFPTSIGNLQNLSTLELSDCQFNGTLPNSMSKLTTLVDLDLSSNNLSGPIPSFRMSKNLTKINLSSNRLTGPVTPAQLGGLVSLVSVNLRSNFLNGTIPSFLFAFPSLLSIDLSNNRFSGVLEFPNAPSSVLNNIVLSSNNLHGPIPMSIFKLKELRTLWLAYNRFNGTIQFDIFQDLSNLMDLGLSYNNLSVITSSKNTNFSSFPNFFELALASCKLQVFPNILKNQKALDFLDLSDNQITGEIPYWIWEVGKGFGLLNLSHNYLVGWQEPYSLSRISVLDLHSNQLRGNILNILPPYALYIDLSSNYFTSSIPADIGENFGRTTFFSLSNNSLTGVIPKSICNGSSLEVVDLSKNNLSGRIPACMPAMSKTLGLNLRRNNLSGSIPNTFPSDCGLKTLDLHGNSLTGMIPKSLASCNALELLDIGNNQMFDSFPLLLKNISTLQVLVMRSNKFFGHITCSESIGDWPVIQIFDVASNNFSGELPSECLTKWHKMVAAKDDAHQILNHLRFKVYALTTQPQYYQNSVTVANKGLEMELVKILTAFTSIDFSSNKFYGEIPKELGQLKSLLVLNLSNNVLSGQIPSSFSSLRELESLDLSRNNLSGTIPQTLSELNFLSFLNLSYNHLVGRIPSGNQIQTFTADRFEGNEGLCGPPLTENCTDGKSPETSKEDGESKSGGIEIEWNLVNVGVGYLVGLGSVIGPLVFWRRWRNCYFNGAEDIAFRILPLPLLRKWMVWKMGKQKRHRIRGKEERFRFGCANVCVDCVIR